MSSDVQYPDHFIERLHTIWGEGFLSPGGPEEVREIVGGIDLAGKVVLDVGFGTGGPAIALVKDHRCGGRGYLCQLAAGEEGVERCGKRGRVATDPSAWVQGGWPK